MNSLRDDAKLDDVRLKKTFDKFWPDFKKATDEALAAARASATASTATRPRDQRDVLDEVLTIVRGIAREIGDERFVRETTFSRAPGANLTLRQLYQIANSDSPGSGSTAARAIIEQVLRRESTKTLSEFLNDAAKADAVAEATFERLIAEKAAEVRAKEAEEAIAKKPAEAKPKKKPAED
jgi:hypothetical protein